MNQFYVVHSGWLGLELVVVVLSNVLGPVVSLSGVSHSLRSSERVDVLSLVQVFE